MKFVLHGKKLRGEFTLVKIKPREDESGDPWLLIKDRDEHIDHEVRSRRPSRIGRKRQDARRRRRGSTREDVAVEAEARGTRGTRAKRRRSKRDPMPHPKSLMLATLIGEPFDDPEWLFEIKWDGYRALCTVDDKGRAHARLPQRPRSARAFSRSGGTRDRVLERARRSWTARSSASIRRAARISSGCRICKTRRSASPTRRSTCSTPTDGSSREPLEKRKALLERLIADETLVLYSKHVIGKGKALFEQAARDAARRHHRQEARLDVSGAPQPRLGEDQGPATSKSSSSAAGPSRRAAEPASARCCSASTRRRSCGTSVRSARASP